MATRGREYPQDDNLGANAQVLNIIKIMPKKIYKVINQNITWQGVKKLARKPIWSPKTKVKINEKFLWLVIAVIFITGFGFGGIYGESLFNQVKLLFFQETPLPVQPVAPPNSDYLPMTTQEQAVINVVKKASRAVVSIVIYKDMPVYETYYEEQTPLPGDFFGLAPFKIEIPKQRQKGVQKQKIGEGTGFIVSADGLIFTNKHVVAEKDAQYSVVANDGKKYDVKVLAIDPFADLAVLKIEQIQKVASEGEAVLESFDILQLGDSDGLQIGQTVVAIGNSLGEFRNTVSVGVISGLGRTITAEGAGLSEVLEDVIQTDAAINRGNSGGPLLNLRGQVIGVNVAMAEGAQSIGFAIPINSAKRAIIGVKTQGKIVYPFLGVRHSLITPEIQEEMKLPVDYGSLIAKGEQNEPAITPGSAADKAGLKPGDIILEVNNEKITQDNSLGKLIRKYQPGDTITLKILRDKKELVLSVTLGSKSSE